MGPYAKAVIAAIAAAATALTAAYTDGHVTPAEWLQIAIAAAAALGVWAVPNQPHDGDTRP